MAQKQKPKIVGDRRWIRYATVFVSLLGLLISGYAYYVEGKMEADKHYKPLCDINKEVRCSKALSSKFGKGFGFLGNVFGHKHTLNQPNTFYGVLFYALMAGLGFARNSKASLVQLNLAFISVLVSGYLAYVLFFVLEEVCPVCIATYAVNIILLLLSIFKGKPHIAETARDSVGLSKKVDGSPNQKNTQKVSDSPNQKTAGRVLPKSTPVVPTATGSASYAQAVKQQDVKKRHD